MQSESFRDQLSIETPEQVSLRFPLAGLGSRALGHLVDLAIQTGFYIAMTIVFVLMLRPVERAAQNMSPHAQTWVFGAFVLLNFVLVWGYFTCFEAFWNGQTPGKRALKLRVLKDTGRQITFFESLTRNLLRIVDALPGVYAVGIVSMLISRENKRLGDLLAGTIVVHVGADHNAAAVAPAGRRITVGFAPAMSYAAPAIEALFPQDALGRLSTEDLRLVESFTARTTELDHDTSERLAGQILERLCCKMKTDLPVGVSSRRALDSIAANLRSTLSSVRS